MAPRIYTIVVTIGDISLYQVTGDPNGSLQATRGSVAFDDSSPPKVWQNTDGATAWTDISSGGGGGSTAPLVFGTGSLSASTTTRFLYPGYDDGLAQTVAIVIEMTQAGTLRNLRIVHNNPGGNGNDIVYTVLKNGGATSIAVTLASNAAAGADTSNSETFVAGDQITIRATKAAGIGGGLEDITATLEAA